jgi:predicted MFS family arabinose efflux permease
MSSSRKMVWIVWLIASLFYAYQYILRVMPSIMLEDIMQQFHIGTAAFGQFTGVYYIGYSLAQLPLGMMLDRFGARKVMTGSILMTVVGLLPLIFAEHWIYPIIGRVFIGIGSSAAILGVFQIVRMTFSENRFPRMVSYSVMIGLIGAIYGGAPVSFLREEFGYQYVLQTFVLSGVLLALITYWIVPDQKQSEEKSSLLSNVKEVFGNAKVIWCCIFAGLMVGPLEGFADVWGTAFLKQVYGLDSAIAASLPSIIFIGMCVGAPILNAIAEKMGNFLATIIGAGAIMTGSFLVLLVWPMEGGSLTFNFLFVGICSAYQIIAIYKASTYVRPQVAGLATAVANMIIMGFGYGFHTAMSTIIGAMGGAQDPTALTYGVAVIPVALAIGTIGFAVLFVYDKAAQSSLARE